jgi:hypothetical protein
LSLLALFLSAQLLTQAGEEAFSSLRSPYPLRA